MSMIVHRCTCEHIDLHHRDRNGHCENNCWCTRGNYEGSSPELIPTWKPTSDDLGTERDNQIVKPGSKVVHYPALCDCGGCQRLYAEVTS
jgi:hypothetical protein